MALGARSTAAEAIDGIDLTGKVAVITGASGGIGLETARALASAGATVVLGNRNQEKAEAAAADLKATVPGATVELGQLDLTDLSSVRDFAGSVNANHEHIDLLINNAGVMATPHERTKDDFELQFGTNHLAHFVLTKHLLPGLLAAGEARVVNVSSNGHQIGGIDFDDPNFREREYTPWGAYGQSKTANVLFTMELERRFGDRGVHAFTIHPGLVDTDLFRYLPDDEKTKLEQRVAATAVGSKSPAQGAATTVFAATSPDLDGKGGAYLEDCQVSTSVAAHASDPADAERLWALSEELTGESFPT